MTRRQFVEKSSSLAAVSILPASSAFSNLKGRKFKMSLKPSAIGVKTDQKGLLDFASKYGFEAIVPMPQGLSAMVDGEMEDFLGKMKEANIVWGAGNLPIDFRKSETKFREDLDKLPKLAAATQKAGAKGMGTWIMPTNNELPYLENFKQHAKRLKAVANILGHYDIRLGLEYVGPKTLMARDRYAFIRTMKEAKSLIHAIDEPNVGLLLDSFHWFCAGETVADLLTLDRNEIVTCDLNDAFKGRSADEQIDGQRELPMATGVIDIKGFLGALVQIGYDGPIRAEPFNKTLNAMDNEEALKTTYMAMKKGFDLVS